MFVLEMCIKLLYDNLDFPPFILIKSKQYIFVELTIIFGM